MYEIRRMPQNWTHPKDSEGNYIPAYRGKFDEINRIDYEDDDGTLMVGEKDFDGISKSTPETELHLYCLYEDESYGTPLSPAFSTEEELAQWLADNYEVRPLNDNAIGVGFLFLGNLYGGLDVRFLDLNPINENMILGLMRKANERIQTPRKLSYENWLKIIKTGFCSPYQGYYKSKMFGFDLGCIPEEDVLMQEFPEKAEDVFDLNPQVDTEND